MLETQFTLLETQFVQVSHFQKSACLFTFISGNFLPTVDKHTFLRFFFQKCKMSMEFSCTFIGSRLRGFPYES